MTYKCEKCGNENNTYFNDTCTKCHAPLKKSPDLPNNNTRVIALSAFSYNIFIISYIISIISLVIFPFAFFIILTRSFTENPVSTVIFIFSGIISFIILYTLHIVLKVIKNFVYKDYKLF